MKRSAKWRDGLSAKQLSAALPEFSIRVFSVLGSTQKWMRAALEAGRIRPPAIVAASRQTAGIGQHGRAWWSDKGSLCVTFALPACDAPPGQIPLRAGLSVAETLARFAAGAEFRLKWPNDVLARGRKIAGILCERRCGCDVIGIGINVRRAGRAMPDALRSLSISLEDLARTPPTRVEVLEDLAGELRRWLDVPEALEAFLQRLDVLYRPVRVSIDTGSLDGRCVGVDGEGRLLVETPGGIVAISDSSQLCFVSSSTSVS